MKQFFSIVFGGLVVIPIGIAIAWGSGQAWNSIAPGLARVRADGSTISGLVRTIRYSAVEEEDLVNQTSLWSGNSLAGPVTARAHIVRDLSTGLVASSFDTDRLLPVASLTKLVTAAVVRREIDPDARITISADVMTAYGNTAGFIPGETFTAKDLLYPLLLVSSNDASEAFARFYGRTRFLKAMNDFAQEIGAYRTSFSDPSGLSERNVSTANDMALVLDWIRTNDPEILKITTQKAKSVRRHIWVNPTHFLSWSYYDGGKNGYTEEANRTSAAMFTLGKAHHPYAVVILGSENRDSDVIKLLNKVK